MAGPDTQLNLGLLLFIPYRAMESRVLAELKRHGHDLPLSQARVFQRISPQGSRLSELADASQLSKQTVGSVVDQLERCRYVQRTVDPEDARARLVVLTERGHEIVRLSEAVVRAVEEEWKAHLGPRKTEQLRRLLTELRAVTDPFA